MKITKSCKQMSGQPVEGTLDDSQVENNGNITPCPDETVSLGSDSITDYRAEACRSIKCAIDNLANIANTDDEARSAIADLAVVLLTLE